MAIQINDGTVTIGENCVVAAQKHGTEVTDRGIGVFIRGTDENADPVLNVHGTISSYGSAIQGNGTDRSNPIINIFEGANVVSDKLAVYLPQPGTVNITGAKVTGYAGIGIKSGTLNIKDSEIHGVAPDDTLGDGHSTTGGINTDGSAIVIDSYVAYAGEMNITISGDSEIISDHSTAIREIGNDDSATNIVTLKIEEGYFSSAEDHLDIMVRNVTKETVEISGGYFTSDPSEYVAEDYIATASNKAGYSWMVTEGSIQENVEPAIAEPSVDESKVDIDENLKEAAINAAESVKANDSLAAAASKEASEINSDTATSLIQRAEENLNPSDGETITLYVQTYLAVTPTEYTSNGTKTLTLDITPKYRIVASTAENADDIDLTEDGRDAFEKTRIFKGVSCYEQSGKNESRI